MFSGFGLSQASADNLDASVETSGDFVLGRSVTSVFSYDIDDPYEPVDTSLVIDESGSMDGVMDDAKDAAKTYVENTNTGQGDENAVVEFEDTASTIQSLTSSKQDAKDEIDSIDAGGGTELPAGVSEGHDSLESGTNAEQVMIVLADGDGNDPGYEADQARADGIKIHGILYGSDASTSEFESLTGSDCTTDSSENGDGDNCWYAEPGTINSVYTSIRETTQTETDTDIRMRLRDFAYESHGNYESRNELSGENQEFVRSYDNVDSGSYKEEFKWRPTVKGTETEMVTGDSLIEVTSEGETNEFMFPGPKLEDVDYVDFNISGYSVRRTSTGVGVEVSVTNEGTEPSYKNEVRLEDSSGNYKVKEIPVLDPGESTEISYSFSNSHKIFDNPEELKLHVDPPGDLSGQPEGFWDGTGHGEGDTLEPNEDNNDEPIGFPPILDSVSPDNVDWNDVYAPKFTVRHHAPDRVSGVYNFTNKTVLEDEDEELSTVPNPDSSNEAVLKTDQYRADPAERYYNFTVNLTDGDNTYSVFDAKSYYPVNPPPKASAVNPENGGFISEFPVTLASEVNDANSEYHGRTLDVSIYDHNDQKLTSAKVMPSDVINYDWDVPDAVEKEYEWTVEVEDKWDAINRTFSFTKIIGSSYRSKLSADLNYTSIIMEAGSNEYATLSIENEVNNRKNITINLNGVEAEFVDGEDSKTIPNFPKQSVETYRIRITPDKAVNDDLIIQVRNNDLGINTTERVPVSATGDTRQSGRDVPGIGFYQLLVLFTAATVLYSAAL
ncbi:vWA domain-containing protein [Candidatus Nanohalobium constans]|uniref:von Willebrand factor type A n=1 Tax=Candidatus Nanohalobium constans TaxID=2565781 RepID=A0A5Q0UGF5_9ARCH|nr:vWA domain-containing protein [Candidatus Nanohalobium constans]QGA80290.1 von Willebrand factor type A [Candidatus Nanohalobium constans]